MSADETGQQTGNRPEHGGKPAAGDEQRLLAAAELGEGTQAPPAVPASGERLQPELREQQTVMQRIVTVSVSSPDGV